MLDITGNGSEYIDTGALYKMGKDGADGELHLKIGFNIGTASEETSYEFILKNAHMANSTMSASGNNWQAALSMTTFNDNRFTLRKVVPTPIGG
jgi:hypothetical protein